MAARWFCTDAQRWPSAAIRCSGIILRPINEISTLTGLRFVAAFLVFIFHINRRTKLSFLPWPVYNIVSHGAFGVTVFFVLSGFLLTYSHTKDFTTGELRNAQHYRRFMYKRLARIYPAYLAGLLLFTGVCALFGQRPQLRLLVPNLLMVQAAIPSISMLWYSSGSWSVSIEVFFYLFFPLLLPLLLRIRQARTVWALLAATILLRGDAWLGYRSRRRGLERV
jgi:peptidoglycan/LPS O-acetylase OafA/YrhL